MRHFIFICIAVITLTLFFSRWVFLTPFDYPYLATLFNESQWRNPLSQRIISDNELYQVAGIQLWRGADVFSINPEVPPLAKYLYGASAEWLGNPYWASLGWYLVATMTFYFLARQLLPKNLSQWAIILLLLNPLFFSQVTQTMLDLPQLACLMIHTLAMILLAKSNSNTRFVWLVIAGISLGAFAGTKIPILAPAVALADAWYLGRKKRWTELLSVFGLSGLSYLAWFTPYFIQGHGLIDWLGAEKWTVEFYRMSRVQAEPLVFFSSVLTGWYHGWWQSGWERVREWTVVWPLSLMALFYGWRTDWRSPKSENWLYLKVIFGLLIASFIVLPFWTRYFLLVLPFGLLFLVRWIASHKHFQWWFGLLSLVLLLQSLLFWRTSPAEMLKFAAQSWQLEEYRDVYNFVTDTSLTREEFAEAQRDAWQRRPYHRSIITLSSQPTWPWQNQSTAELDITFYIATRSAVYNRQLPLTRVNNQWKIVWPSTELYLP